MNYFDELLQNFIKIDRKSIKRADVLSLAKQCNPHIENAIFVCRGGESVVFMGVDKILDRFIIIKILLPKIDGKDKQRLFRGLGIQQKMHGIMTSALVPDIFSYRFDQSPYVEMQYLKGVDFMSYVLPLSKKKKFEMLLALAKALDEIHRYGVVHSDFKSENILVTESGEIVVLDWSMAVELERPDARLTRIGEMFGTEQTSAPEQLDGRAMERDYRSDIYSFGTIFYSCLTGKYAKKNPVGHTFDETLLTLAETEFLHVCTNPDTALRYQNTYLMIEGLKMLLAESEEQKIGFADESNAEINSLGEPMYEAFLNSQNELNIVPPAALENIEIAQVSETPQARTRREELFINALRDGQEILKKEKL